MPLPVDEFDYELPPQLIAQVPAEPRDHSRLLVVDRNKQMFADRYFYDLPEILRPGDLLVVNNTKVIQARLHLTRKTGGQVEFLFLRQTKESAWLVLARPSRRLRIGEMLEIVDSQGKATGRTAEVLGRSGSQLIVEVEDARQTLRLYGNLPLPPYIEKSIIEQERYQTVYGSESGSAAAPTAGLHFTQQLIDTCTSVGIVFASVTLHIGLDTFQPVRVDDALQHTIHSEWYSMPEKTVSQLEETRNRGGRIIGVGTTSVRVLETVASQGLEGRPSCGWTSLYITPPFNFQLTDGMITNFHLPRTTLLMMVTAFAGRDLLFGAYRHAIESRYRFYSFGDAMLIV